ncbi:hypothetical protein PaeBR_13860 [Paenibacillus sp. BR2-3]
MLKTDGQKGGGYSSGLNQLGRIDSGMETLMGMNGDFTITIELAEE